MLAQAVQLLLQGDYPRAIALLQQALSLQPEHFETRLQLAKAYLDWIHIQVKVPLTDIEPSRLGEDGMHYLALAESQLGMLAKTHPSSAHVQGLLAVVHLMYKRYADASVCLKKALAKDPANPELIYNMGLSLVALRRLADAEKQFARLTRLQPGHGMAWHMLGEAIRRGGNPEASLPAYRQAIKLLPDWPQPWGGLGTALIELGRHEEWLPYMERAVALEPDSLLHYTNLLFSLHLHPGLPPEEISARHRAFGKHFESLLNASRQPHGNVPDPIRRLRVGFVSGDLRVHPVGHFMVELLRNLKANEFDLVAYSTSRCQDWLTESVRPAFAIWRDCGEMSEAGLVAQIRADEIDILVDLAGHTEGNQLLVFARKPAPVQVTYLGYFDTTGLSSMDYILGNRWLLPEAEEGLYTEKPWRLPDAHLCFAPPEVAVEVGPLPAMGAGGITFGCFNKAEKVNARVIACWSKILHATPGSRLFLKSKPFSHAPLARLCRERFAAHGIGAERLILEGDSGFTEYLESYGRVDIALDPYPYNGGTTTVQALWMGVPTLALRGDRYVAHMGESILNSVGMPDWVAADEAEYVAKAVAHAGDLTALSALRGELRQRLLASPICDAPRFAQNVTDAFRGMWREWCKHAH